MSKNIILEKKSLNNFLSLGEEETVLSLNTNEIDMNIGSNGAGKSTLIGTINHAILLNILKIQLFSFLRRCK